MTWIIVLLVVITVLLYRDNQRFRAEVRDALSMRGYGSAGHTGADAFTSGWNAAIQHVRRKLNP